MYAHESVDTLRRNTHPRTTPLFLGVFFSFVVLAGIGFDVSMRAANGLGARLMRFFAAMNYECRQCGPRAHLDYS